MEVQTPTSVGSSYSQAIHIKYSADILVLSNSFGGGTDAGDSADASINDLPKSLTVSAQEIVAKLNEILKAKLPDGIESLKPEEATPEATADKIVQGATSFFEIYKQQNPDLSNEDLLRKFMETIRSGIDQGYGQAVDTLEGLGAFQFDGVKDGIEKTKSLIEDKLKAYEAQKRQELGLAPVSPIQEEVGSQTAGAIESQAGKALSVLV